MYSRLAGYEHVNDAERLCHDPTFRLMGSEKIWDRGAALTSRLQAFETDMPGEQENLPGLRRLSRAPGAYLCYNGQLRNSIKSKRNSRGQTGRFRTHSLLQASQKQVT